MHWIVLAAVFDLTVAKALLPSAEILSERCEGRSACTRFVSERLDVQCTQESGLWKMTANAKALAIVYYRDSSFMPHEAGHIADMRNSVNTHVAALEAKRFEDPNNCKSAAALAAAEFRSTMIRFAFSSMRERH